MEAASAIIGLAAVGAKVYVTLQSFISACEDAPSIARDTCDEVRAFRYAVDKLRPYIVDSATITPLGLAVTDVNQLSLTLGSCIGTFSQIQEILKRLLPAGSNIDRPPRLTYVDRIRWTMAAGDLSRLLTRIQQHKSTLTLLLTIWKSNSSAESENCTDLLNDILKRIMAPATPTQAQLSSLTPETHTSPSSIDNAENSAITGKVIGLVNHDTDSVSVMTTNSSFSKISIHSFTSALRKSRPYRKDGTLDGSCLSTRTSQRQGITWSHFTGGSNQSVFSLPCTQIPVTLSSLSNQYWYLSKKPDDILGREDIGTEVQRLQFWESCVEIAGRSSDVNAALTNIPSWSDPSMYVDRAIAQGWHEVVEALLYRSVAESSGICLDFGDLIRAAVTQNQYLVVQTLKDHWRWVGQLWEHEQVRRWTLFLLRLDSSILGLQELDEKMKHILEIDR